MYFDSDGGGRCEIGYVEAYVERLQGLVEEMKSCVVEIKSGQRENGAVPEKYMDGMTPSRCTSGNVPPE